jgi:hypothetical protein
MRDQVVADHLPHHLRRGQVLLRTQVLEGRLLVGVDQQRQARGLQLHGVWWTLWQWHVRVLHMVAPGRDFGLTFVKRGANRAVRG